MASDSRRRRRVPVRAGTARQLPGPCSWMWETRTRSSSGVHGPFFTPSLSQHGGLTMVVEEQGKPRPSLRWILLISEGCGLWCARMK
jgi:hypothetical protein